MEASVSLLCGHVCFIVALPGNPNMWQYLISKWIASSDYHCWQIVAYNKKRLLSLNTHRRGFRIQFWSRIYFTDIISHSIVIKNSNMKFNLNLASNIERIYSYVSIDKLLGQWFPNYLASAKVPNEHRKWCSYKSWKCKNYVSKWIGLRKGLNLWEFCIGHNEHSVYAMVVNRLNISVLLLLVNF
jgi:hypothetical protein